MPFRWRTEIERGVMTLTDQPDRIVLGLTGASGAAYGIRLAQVLLHAGTELHLVASSAAFQVMARELGSVTAAPQTRQDWWLDTIENSLTRGHCHNWDVTPLDPNTSRSGQLRVWELNNFSAGIASGSFMTQGMVLCPCSMGTLASIANGASSNVIHRAADVHLKERRPLIIVPRETPLSPIQLQNMLTLSQAGATVMPSMPGYYHQPESIGALIDFIVARICDHLHIPHTLSMRWGEGEAAE